MLGFAVETLAESAETILCLGAHPDDIEIGCGGTLMTLLRHNPRIEVRWVVFSGSDRRAAEARAGAESFLSSTPCRGIEVHAFRESYFPYEGAQLKDTIEELASRIAPDMIFTHRRTDLHQDHRVVAELTWNAFRDHMILEYEIPKYDGDPALPNVFVPLDEDTRNRKVRAVVATYRSQRDKPWFSEETFHATLRLRGIECRSPSGYAEGFHASKLVLA